MKRAETIKKLVTDFFRHWWNTPGNNTDQGFDDWWKDNKQNCAIADELQTKELTDEEIRKLAIKYGKRRAKEVYDAWVDDEDGTPQLTKKGIADIELDFIRGYMACKMVQR